MDGAAIEAGVSTLRRRAKAAVFSCYLFIVVYSAQLAIEVGTLPGLLSIEAFPALYVVVAAGWMLAFLASAVLIGRWIHRAHANLFAAGCPGLEFTPGWSVGWFFVPVASLFKPFQAMRELWNASTGNSDDYAAPAPNDLTVWWTGYLVGNILSGFSTRLPQPGDAATLAHVIDPISTAALIVSAIYLIRIVRRVTEGQEARLGLGFVFA